jgi:cation diffusion facilitator CzcD-associated flavoprotein CzcO
VQPRFDNPYSPEQQAEFARRPWQARKHRWQIWWTYQRSSFQVESKLTALQTGIAQSYLERKIEDPALRTALTPDFPVGCKRPLFSRDWFPALSRPNVSLVTSPITSISETAVHTADGATHPVDTIIFGTGFRAADYLSSVEVIGRDHQRLRDAWRDGAEAYLGLTVSGFPNFFLLYGPNTNGVNSILFMHEAQVHYVMRALRMMRRRRLGAIDVKATVQRRYNAKVQAAMAGTVWLAGCTNYFSAPSGKVVTQLPYSAGEYWLRTRTIGVWRYRTQRRRRSTIIDADEVAPYDRSASQV